MKKSFYGIFSGIVAGVMIGTLSVAASAEAAADNKSVQARYIEKRVVVSGHIDQSEALENNMLTILLSDENNNIAYINEAAVDDYGDYKHSFEFMGENGIDSYDLKVKAGETDVTDSAKSIGYFTDMIEAEAVKSGKNETGSAEPAEAESVEIGVKLINDYYMTRDYTMYAAAYSADNTLIDVNVFPNSLKPSDSGMRKFLRLNKNGRDISEVRLYVWDKDNGIKPLGKVFAFGGDNVDKIKNAAEKTVYKRIEAETFSEENSKNVKADDRSFGVQNKECKKMDTNMCFKDVDLANVKSVIALADTNRDNEYLEFRIDSPTGELIGKLPLVNGGGSAHDSDLSYTLTYAGIKETSGKHDLYIVRPGESIANFILEHFVLSSEKLSESGENNEPFYSEGKDIKLSADKKTAEYSFYGTGIDYITNLSDKAGEVEIFIDGKEDKTINLNKGQELKDRTVYTKTGLSKWNHTIKIVSDKAITANDIKFKVYQRPIIVACMGDSITDGVGTANHIFSWPAQLQKRLGTGYYVVDCGHNGSTTEGIFVFSQGKTALKLNADIFINALYTNDSENVYGTKDEVNNGGKKFKDTYQSVMDKLKGSSPDARMYVAIPPCGNTNDDFKPWWETKKKWTEELALKNNWPVIDFDYVLKDHRDDALNERGFYFIDNCHPSEKGYSFMAAAAKMSLPCPELLDSTALDNEIKRLDALDSSDKYNHSQLESELNSLDESGNLPANN